MRCRIVLQTPSDKKYKKDDVHVVHRNRTVDLKSASATTTSHGLSYLLVYKFNMVRTQFTLNEVAICFASHRFALITSKRLCLLPSKVYARFQEQRTLLVRPVFLQENDEFKNEGKNSNTALIMDNKSRHSFMLGDLATEVALDTEYLISLVYR